MTKRRMLIVDDEVGIREVAQISLEMIAGWKALTASSACEELRKARTDQSKAILLDVMMIDMDGPTTFQKLQADPAIRHIPVVLLTAKLQPADRKRFAELGVAGVLAKPFDPLELAGQVAKVLDWPM